MQTITHSSRFLRHALTLLFAALLAISIWLAGYVELSWLGFALAATHTQTSGERPMLTRLSRRARS